MMKSILTVAASLAMVAGAQAADLKMPVKAVAPVYVSPWDVAFGASLASDYLFRGITQSNHKPGVAAYIEPRYNINPNLQVYAGIGGASISFTNRAAAEIDFYAGIRPTFGPLAFDLGVWYYYYPGGQCIDGQVGGGLVCPFGAANVPNLNVQKEDVSFLEVYAKATWTINDMFAIGGTAFYSPDFLHSGADGTYLSANAKFTGPVFGGGIGWYVSGEVGYQMLGTSDAFYSLGAYGAGTPFSLTGIDFPDYTHWNIGIGFTYKVFTLDLRYSGTDLTKSDCNGLTGDFQASGIASPVFPAAGFNPVNPTGVSSNWCDDRFVAKLSFDSTLNALK